MSLPKIEERPVLKKHVNTIHCSNNLTLVQRKLFNALLFNAYHELSEKSEYQIAVKYLCKLIGYDSRDYKKIRKSILDLIMTAIEWNVIDQENGEQKDKWRASAILSAAKIENGICTYEFSSVMRELLYMPEVYGKIDINVMVEFKSSYALALYENCIRFQGISQTQWLSLNVFRKLMGIQDGKYQKFCDLKKRVLDIAVNEVNKYSPLHVVPEIQRINKKVTCIRFKLSNTKVNALNEIEKKKNAQPRNELFNTLKRDFYLSEEAILDLISKYDTDYIENKVNLIKKSDSFKLGKIRALAAYLIDALKRDYQVNRSSQKLLLDKQEEIQQRVTKLRKDEDRLRQENGIQKRKIVEDYLSKMNHEEHIKLLKKFEKYIEQHNAFYIYKKYKEVGMQSSAVRGVFNAFVSQLINLT